MHFQSGYVQPISLRFLDDESNRPGKPDEKTLNRLIFVTAFLSNAAIVQGDVKAAEDHRRRRLLLNCLEFIHVAGECSNTGNQFPLVRTWCSTALPHLFNRRFKEICRRSLER